MPDPEDATALLRPEDSYWIAKAEEGVKSGFLSPEETMAFLLARYNEEEEE